MPGWQLVSKKLRKM